MDKSTKVDYLYKIAMGQPVNLSPDQRRELSKYKVEPIGKPLTTKTNISQYVTAVDRGSRRGFYDWCLDNHKGDGRTKGGSAQSIKSFNSGQNSAAIFIGWLPWGLALYWLFDQSVGVGGCAILGGIISLIAFKVKREWAMFTCFLLPIIIAVLCYT